MTTEEIDRTIAEHVGTADRWLIVKRGCFYRPEAKGYTSSESEAWKLPLAEAKKHEYLIGDEPVTLSLASIPAYSTDLNAMHEAEKTLTDQDPYLRELQTVTQTWDHVDADGDEVDWFWELATATATQRAEAFLRTIGKWRDA